MATDQAKPETDKVFTREQLAKMAKGATVRVQLVDKKTAEKSVVDQPIAAEHVLSHRMAGDKVIITTIDGQKIEAAL